VLLDCVIYCAFYSILFRGAVFSGHVVHVVSICTIRYDMIDEFNVNIMLFSLVVHLVIVCYSRE